MTVKSVEKDTENLALTLTAEFAAQIERVWRLWEDPRQLERWWGPPEYPATFVDHDFVPGGTVSYFMTGPEGEKYHGWWKINDLESPLRIHFEDGFSDENGNPDPDMPTTLTTVTFDQIDPTTTRMELRTLFPSPEAMEQMVEMGMEVGLTLAVGQMDDLLSTEAGR